MAMHSLDVWVIARIHMLYVNQRAPAMVWSHLHPLAQDHRRGPHAQRRPDGLLDRLPGRSLRRRISWCRSAAFATLQALDPRQQSVALLPLTIILVAAGRIVG